MAAPLPCIALALLIVVNSNSLLGAFPVRRGSRSNRGMSNTPGRKQEDLQTLRVSALVEEVKGLLLGFTCWHPPRLSVRTHCGT